MTCRTLLPVSLVLLGLAGQAVAATSRKAPSPQQAAQREERTSAITVLSIIPAQGEPGMSVTLNGSGFTEKTVAYLGNAEIPAMVIDSKQLSFEIADLPPGLYALYLRREDGVTSKPYNFTLLPQKPIANALFPDTVYNCSSGKEREVTVNGKNFQQGAQLLLDGAALPKQFISTEALSFHVPPIPGGLHQVQVKNPSDAISGALALFVDSKPEIQSISQGADFVSYYELIIVGRNFHQSSMVMVDGTRVPVGTVPPGGRELVLYGGCNRLVYQRHPYDASPKSFRIQIINPNGEESQAVSVNAP